MGDHSSPKLMHNNAKVPDLLWFSRPGFDSLKFPLPEVSVLKINKYNKKKYNDTQVFMFFPNYISFYNQTYS